MVFSHKCGLNTRYVLSTVYAQLYIAAVLLRNSDRRRSPFAPKIYPAKKSQTTNPCFDSLESLFFVYLPCVKS